MAAIREPKTFYFDLSKDVDKNVNRGIEFIIKHNESFSENKIENKIEQYCPNISLGTIFINTENSRKMNLIKLFLTCHKRYT